MRVREGPGKHVLDGFPGLRDICPCLAWGEGARLGTVQPKADADTKPSGTHRESEGSKTAE